jgi:DNA-binding beta-propeller fold protein YncE
MQKRLWRLILIAGIVLVFNLCPWGFLIGLDHYPRPAHAEQSDRDHDGDVDLDDLALFSSKRLKKDWQKVDWCQWLNNGYRNKNSIVYQNKQHLDELYEFIKQYFGCGQIGEPPPEGNLTVVHTNDYPLRIALGPNGRLYVSNAQIGSVFIYEVGPGSLSLIGELKGLVEPLGVAVDSLGRIYVGSDDSDSIEVYDSDGYKVGVIGPGKVKMPNDLAFDRNGNLYVVDSVSNRVYVYDPNWTLLGSIGSRGDGDGRFRFPCSLLIWYRPDGFGGEYAELYVADQGHGLVQVFDLEGNFRRSFGGIPSSGMMGWKLKGKFARLQSLQVDGYDRLHALDSHMSTIQILNPDSGSYLVTYSSRGSDPGQLRLPLDMVIDGNNQVIVANYSNKRIEIISVP